MTFEKVLEETTVPVCFEKLGSRFKRYCEIYNHFTVYTYFVLKEKGIFLPLRGYTKLIQQRFALY